MLLALASFLRRSKASEKSDFGDLYSEKSWVNMLVEDDQHAKLITCETILRELDENRIFATSAEKLMGPVLLRRDSLAHLIEC